VEKYVKGELPDVSEHIAGGLAKLAFEQLRNERAI